MFEKVVPGLFHVKPTMENVRKDIKINLDIMLGDENLAEDRWEIEVFQKRPELREQLANRLEQELSDVLEEEDIHSAFRELVVDTIHVSVVNELLIAADDCEFICRSINRGIKSNDENGDRKFKLLTQMVNQTEAFSDYEWSYGKAAHESAWAEMKLHVLRQLQIAMFESVPGGSESDWWDVYRKSYTMYINDLYKVIVQSGEEHKGFPHPIVAAMSNETLADMRDKLYDSVFKCVLKA